MSSDQHDALLDGLWAQFGHIAWKRVDLLATAVTLLRAGGDDAGAASAAARAECHKLVGSLDSYGRSGGSALAARAEVLLSDLLDRPDESARPARLRELEEVVAGLRALFAEAPSPAPEQVVGTCICSRCGDVHRDVAAGPPR